MNSASPVIDLTDFGYLGFRHQLDELAAWERLTSGRPAILEETPVADALARRLAALQGCAAGTLAPSTLHVFCDLFAALGTEDVALLIDEHAYPIARWGADRAIAGGTPVITFRHGDPEALEPLLVRSHQQLKRPVVIVDGTSAFDWSPAPLAGYLNHLEPYGGLLVVDDTQAIGLLGHSSTAEAPFGFGGGGSLRWHEVESTLVLVVCSLTKAFGVPVAAVSGCKRLVDWFRMKSESRTHCSPPSAAALSALEHALQVNDSHGDEIRKRLTGNLSHFRRLLADGGAPADTPFFPVHSVHVASTNDPAWIRAELQARGVRAHLQQHADKGARLLLVITAAHDCRQLEFAANVVLEVLKMCPRTASS